MSMFQDLVSDVVSMNSDSRQGSRHGSRRGSKDYGESEKTVCCTHCRCDLDDKNTKKRRFLDIDSFNGA